MNTDHVELLGRAHIPLSEKEMIGFGKKYTADEEKCQTFRWAPLLSFVRMSGWKLSLNSRTSYTYSLN